MNKQIKAIDLTSETQRSDDEQRELHRMLVQKLSSTFAQNIGDMTKPTAMNVAIDFCVATLVYIFQSTNTIPDLKGKVVGDEVTRRINELVVTAQGRGGS